MVNTIYGGAMKRYGWLIVIVLVVVVWTIIGGYSAIFKPHPLKDSSVPNVHIGKSVNASHPVSTLFRRAFKKRSIVDKLERLGRAQSMVAANIADKNITITAKQNGESAGLNSGYTEGETSYQESASESSDWIYISEYSTNQITKCLLQNQVVSNCYIVLNRLEGPENIIIVGDILYVINLNQPILQMCKLDLYGNIRSCTEIELASEYLQYIAYYNHQLFISDGPIKKGIMCNLDNDNIVLNCGKVSANMVRGVIDVAYWNNYSYSIVMANKGSQVLRCSNTSCSNISDASISSPTVIQTNDNSAYITNYNTNTLISCGLKNNGDFTNCKILKSGFASPVGIAFYSVTHRSAPPNATLSSSQGNGF